MTTKSLVSFIKASQTSRGSWIGTTSANPSFSRGHDSTTTFHTSLIACALEKVPAARPLREQAVRYLMSQRSDSWSWNYWDRSHPRSKTLPDDWDDTAAALAAISSFDATLLDERVLAAVVRNLIISELAPGGPYGTWMVTAWKHTTWHDVDIVVNSAIARFLVMRQINLPPLVAWIEQAVRQGNYSSRYYKKSQIIYFLSTWYRGSVVPLLQQEIKKLLRKKTNPLDLAQLTTAWLRFGGAASDTTPHIKLLKRYAARKTAPEPFPCFVEEVVQGIPYYSGSSALTAACILEAFAAYDEARHQETEQAAALRAAADARTIGLFATQRFSHLPEMKKNVAVLVHQLAIKDPTHEIALLPEWFAESLNSTLGKPSKKFLRELGTVNTLGWIGYTIVDKVLDGEDHKALLPVSTICIREVTAYYEKLFANDPKALRFVTDILDGIDQANFWEHQTCKIQKASTKIQTKELPNYGSFLPLAEKSLGHALGPIAIILKNQKLSASQRFTAANLVKQFFIHYIIARQLNDDAHDWLADLDQGFLNSASVELLKDVKRRRSALPPLLEGVGGVSILDLNKNREELQKLFWNKTIDTVADNIRAHASRARAILRKLQKSGILAETGKLESLLTPLEHSADMAIRERDSTKRFLKEYK